MDCPACAETIPNGTKICPFCKTNVAEFARDVAEERAERPRAAKSAKSKSTPLLLILGAVVGTLLLCGGVLLALLLPAVQQAREDPADAVQKQSQADCHRPAQLPRHLWIIPPRGDLQF